MLHFFVYVITIDTWLALGVGLVLSWLGSQFERDPVVLGWPELQSSWPLRQSLKILQLSIAIQLAASHRGARAIDSVT